VAEQALLFGGRYRVLALLGDGGMARVYLALDDRLGRSVALKTLHAHHATDPEMVARFTQEARLAARLSHPHIISIYDVGEADGGTPFLVMEYVQGETLKQLIRREAPLPPERATALLAQVASALDAAHHQGIVHRDVKLENIVLTSTGQVKVGDFGIARALASTSEATSKLTTTGTVWGSVPYLAPEVAQGQPATASSDLYAAAIVFFELVTGRLPFEGETAVAVALQRITQAPPLPSSLNPALSPALDAVLLRALDRTPQQRYPSGAALAAALEHAEGAATSVSTPPHVAPSLVPTTRIPVPNPTRLNRRPAAATWVRRLGVIAAAAIALLAIAIPLVHLAGTLVPSGLPPRHAPSPPMTPPTASPVAATGVTLTVARGITTSFAPVDPATTFAATTPHVYAIARWTHAASGKAMSFRWRTPAGQTVYYSGCAQGWTTCYVELSSLSAGAYHVVVTVDQAVVAARDFNVLPAGRAP
jgi:serine/threonine-protein kinase